MATPAEQLPGLMIVVEAESYTHTRANADQISTDNELRITASGHAPIDSVIHRSTDDLLEGELVESDDLSESIKKYLEDPATVNNLRLIQLSRKTPNDKPVAFEDLLDILQKDIERYARIFADDREVFIKKRLKEIREKITHDNPGLPTDDIEQKLQVQERSLRALQDSCFSLHRNVQIENYEAGQSFTFNKSSMPGISPVKVEFAPYEKNQADGSATKVNRILISGDKDNLDSMLAVALQAKQLLGGKAKFLIYPTDNLEAAAKLRGKAEARGLKVEYAPKPPADHNDEGFKLFKANMESTGSQNHQNTAYQQMKQGENFMPMLKKDLGNTNKSAQNTDDVQKSPNPTSPLPTLSPALPKPPESPKGGGKGPAMFFGRTSTTPQKKPVQFKKTPKDDSTPRRRNSI